MTTIACIPPFATAAFASALLLGCAPPARERVPDVAGELAVLGRRVERLGRVRAAAERLDVAELEVALASTSAERRVARGAWLSARRELSDLSKRTGGRR